MGRRRRSAAASIATAELADLCVDQCLLVEDRFTLIAPDDYRKDFLEIKLFNVRGEELASESLYAEDGEDDEDEDETLAAVAVPVPVPVLAHRADAVDQPVARPPARA